MRRREFITLLASAAALSPRTARRTSSRNDTAFVRPPSLREATLNPSQRGLLIHDAAPMSCPPNSRNT